MCSNPGNLFRLILNQGFFCGYSPERINPGDKKHRITDIVKITSGSTAAAADYINEVYNLIVTTGTHRAPSIRVAEAAKVIENTQRDLNIALMNELAIIFGKLILLTEDVLDAAGSKWNSHLFGMVGGHYKRTHTTSHIKHKKLAIILKSFFLAEELMIICLNMHVPFLLNI